ncbi:hypothetical protein HK102_004532 [Quaeritorhiza haematococci]|nr:hypothetical protein HK102_004532 [Quaeritorhiza haematococci]
MRPTLNFVILCLAAWLTVACSLPLQASLANIYFTVNSGSNEGNFGSTITNGPLHANTNFTVTYNPARGKCEHLFVRGFDTWSVFMGYKSSDGTAYHTFAKVAYVDPSFRGLRTPVVTIPAMPAGKAEFWFYCEDSEAHVVYDSNWGKNWVFEIVA